jgi:hypothetical protein
LNVGISTDVKIQSRRGLTDGLTQLILKEWDSGIVRALVETMTPHMARPVSIVPAKKTSGPIARYTAMLLLATVAGLIATYCHATSLIDSVVSFLKSR